MDSTAEKLLFATARRQIHNQHFSKKSIRREKRKLIDERRQHWASLGGEKLHLLAARYSPELHPAKATFAQIAYHIHRLVTTIPNLVLAPIAGALGSLGAQWTMSDERALTSLKQRHLLETLRKLNKRIDELYESQSTTPAKQREDQSTRRGKIAISKGVKEDLKAILAYAKAFRCTQFEQLREQVERFEGFVELVNAGQHTRRSSQSGQIPFVDPIANQEP